MNVQNEKTSLEEDVDGVVGEKITNTVFDIFKAVLDIEPLDDLFKDLTERLVTELEAQSFMEFNLELTKEQRTALGKAVLIRSNETVRQYLANFDKDARTQKVYDIVKEKTRGIADAVLSSIGQTVNRGAIINAVAVQANAKSEKFDEILLQKSKSSGDITIPTNCILISTNCVSVIQSACERQIRAQERNKEGENGEKGQEEGQEEEREDEDEETPESDQS